MAAVRNRNKRGRGAVRKSPQARAVSLSPLQRAWRSAEQWLNRLMVGGAAAVVLAAMVWAGNALYRIPVQHIVVQGELEHTSPEALQALVWPALQGGFLGADLDAIRDRLTELPWVYRANVRRSWPHSLHITVTEQRPIARWGEAGFLNHEGELFDSAAAERHADLPLLRGPEGSSRQLMSDYLQASDLLAPLGLSVAALQQDARGEVTLTVEAGFPIWLGQGDVVEKVHRFAAVYERELKHRSADLERVDLRYQNGLAVAFRETETLAGLLPGQTAEE